VKDIKKMKIPLLERLEKASENGNRTYCKSAQTCGDLGFQ